MPSDCGRIPTSSIFITTYSDNDHFIVTSQRNYAPRLAWGESSYFASSEFSCCPAAL